MLRLLASFTIAMLAGLPASAQGPFGGLGRGGKTGGKPATGAPKKGAGKARKAERQGPVKLHPLLEERLELGPISSAEAELLIRMMLDPSLASAVHEAMDPTMQLELREENSRTHEAIAAYVESQAEAAELRRLDPDHLRLEGPALDARTLRSWFVGVDFDRKGTRGALSFYELRVASGLGLRQFHHLDTDRDGALSLQEYGLAVIRVADSLAFEIDPELMRSFLDELAEQDSAPAETEAAPRPYSAPFTTEQRRLSNMLDRARSLLGPEEGEGLRIELESAGPGADEGAPEDAGSLRSPDSLPQTRRELADELADRLYPRQERSGSGDWGKGSARPRSAETKAEASEARPDRDAGSAKPKRPDPAAPQRPSRRPSPLQPFEHAKAEADIGNLRAGTRGLRAGWLRSTEDEAEAEGEEDIEEAERRAQDEVESATDAGGRGGGR